MVVVRIKDVLLQRLVSEMAIRRKAAYVMNLDPAVGKVPYECNIDIRDTVNYKEVMKSYVPQQPSIALKRRRLTPLLQLQARAERRHCHLSQPVRDALRPSAGVRREASG